MAAVPGSQGFRLNRAVGKVLVFRLSFFGAVSARSATSVMRGMHDKAAAELSFDRS